MLDALGRFDIQLSGSTTPQVLMGFGNCGTATDANAPRAKRANLSQKAMLDRTASLTAERLSAAVKGPLEPVDRLTFGRPARRQGRAINLGDSKRNFTGYGAILPVTGYSLWQPVPPWKVNRPYYYSAANLPGPTCRTPFKR